MRAILILATSLLLFNACELSLFKPKAPEVTDFTVTQNAGEILFTYNCGEGATYLELSYDLSSNILSLPDNGNRETIIDFNSTTKTLDELSLVTGETYSFYIRSVTEKGKSSEWTGPQSITIGAYCEEPYSFTYSLGLYWDTYYNQTDATNFDVEYGQEGFTVGGGTRITVNTEYCFDMILNQGTTYDFYVRSKCEDNLGYSNWVGPVSYYAEKNHNVCMVPTNVGYVVERNFFGDAVGASFSWDDNGGNPSYEYNVVLPGQAPETNGYEDGTSRTVTYLQMTQNTDFHFFVRTVCVDGSRTQWIGPLLVNIGS